MIIGFPETEPCPRCNGRGHFFIRLGIPGQDRRQIGGYRNIQWQQTRGPYWCQVCGATGQRKLRRRKQQGPRFVHFDTEGNKI